MRPLDVVLRSRSRIAVAIAWLAACGTTPREPSRPGVVPALTVVERGHLTTDPDLNRQPPPKLLAIDWSATQLATDADALALWERIAPTGADWSDKLDELPDDGDIAVKLAWALLGTGNFTCVPASAAGSCNRTPVDVPEPRHDATLVDPCLRRVLAIWSIGQLAGDDLAAARDALRAIAAIPPPESELVAAALRALPETDHDGRLELYAIAFRAGHRDLVNGMMSSLDEPHLLDAVQNHHIDGALDLLTAETHRTAFLAAIADEQLHPQARIQSISELVDASSDGRLDKSARTAIIRATRSASCPVAAAAARFLVRSGDRKFGPARPRTTKPAAMLRSLCVLASYEAGLRADEPSYLLGYVPKQGLELVTTSYDEYNETDADGDGDPHTEHSAVLVPRDEVLLPEVEDLVRAFEHCTGTTCRSEDREFRFVFKRGGGGLVLTRLEVTELAPCANRAP